MIQRMSAVFQHGPGHLPRRQRSAQVACARATRQGVIGTYIHPGSQLGVMVEVNCESDFVARTDDFQQIVHDIAMQIAAADPQFIRKEDVTPEILEKEKEIARDRARQEGKPEKVLDKIVEGRLAKFYEEVCLLEQPFIKENSITVTQLLADKSKAAGDEIQVAGFVRFKVGDTTAGDAAE